MRTHTDHCVGAGSGWGPVPSYPEVQGRAARTDHKSAAHGGGMVADTSLSYRTSRMVVVSRSVVAVAVRALE